MNTTMITVKITPQLKKAAQEKAERMNLSLSAVIKNNLMRFVSEKETVFVDDYDDTVYTKEQVDELLRATKSSHHRKPALTFRNSKTAISHLKSL